MTLSREFPLPRFQERTMRNRNARQGGHAPPMTHDEPAIGLDRFPATLRAMSTLAEIETAADSLSSEEKKQLPDEANKPPDSARAWVSPAARLLWRTTNWSSIGDRLRGIEGTSPSFSARSPVPTCCSPSTGVSPASVGHDALLSHLQALPGRPAWGTSARSGSSDSPARSDRAS